MKKSLFLILGLIVFSAGCLGQTSEDFAAPGINDSDSTSSPGEDNTTTNVTEEPDDNYSANDSDTVQGNTGMNDTAESTKQMEFTIEADDDAFFMNSNTISSIDVDQDSEVTITFQVSEENTYYGGLEFKSNKFDSPDISPGESWTTTFTADNEFIITSYWPSDNVKKADLTVTVE